MAKDTIHDEEVLLCITSFQKGNIMNNAISVNPNIHFGKPCIMGTRIIVQNVLELIREGISFEDILRDYYHDLKIEDLQACLEYAIHMIAVEAPHISLNTAVLC